MSDYKDIINYTISTNALNNQQSNDYYYDKIILFTVYKTENDIIKFEFHQNITVLSPTALVKKGNARFDYKDILNSNSPIIKYKFVIAKSENIFLLIDLSYKNDIKIDFFHNTEQILSFSSGYEIDFSIYISDSLSELIKKNTNRNGNEDSKKALSVIIDYKKYLSNNLNISSIKKTFPNFTDSIIIKNWNNSIKTDVERHFLENIYQKTSINDIDLLIFYDDTILSAKNDDTIYVKNLKEDYITPCGRKICDLVSKDGGKVLSENLSALSKYCVGILFLPYPIEYNEKINNSKYLSFRTETSVEQFYNKLRLYYIRLNDAVKGRVFVKNLLSTDIPSLRKLISVYTEDDLTRIRDFFLQGYCDLDLIIDNIKNIDKNTVKNICLFSLLFYYVFMDYDITVKLNKTLKLFSFFEKILKLKNELSIVLDAFYYDLKKRGLLSLDYILKNDKLFGFIINQSYAFVNTFPYFSKKTAYIPEGKWFDIESDIFLTEGRALAPKDIDAFVLLKINNALIKKNIRSKLLYNYEIIIYADKDFETYFDVADQPNPVSHKIKLRYDKESVSISFITTGDIPSKCCYFKLILNKNINRIQINGCRISFKQTSDIIYFEYNKLKYENVIELS